VRREIDAELETIVLKCLSKESVRRYQSAGELARDIRLYLAGEPIEAKRDSAMYVLRKSIRRHRVAVGLGAALTLVLAMVAAASIWLAVSESRRGDAAEGRADELAGSAEGFDALLNAGGDPALAEPAFRQALADARAQHGDSHPLVAVRLFNLAALLQVKGDDEEAERLFRETLELRRRLHGDRHPFVAQALVGLASLAARRGDHAAAVDLYEEAAAAYGSGDRVEDRRDGAMRIGMARSLAALGRFEEGSATLLPGGRLPLPERAPAAFEREYIAAIVEVYAGWAAASPGAGHGAEAAKWRRRLDGLPELFSRPRGTRNPRPTR
jgi:tetratricopeptide (TPR) repeat protein